MEIGVSWTSIVHQELMMKQVGVEHPCDCVVSRNDHFFSSCVGSQEKCIGLRKMLQLFSLHMCCVYFICSMVA